MGEYWKYERRLYAYAWAQVWPKSAVSVALNISGPFLIGAAATGVYTVGMEAGPAAIVAVISEQILAALVGGAIGTVGWGFLRFWYGLILAPFMLDKNGARALAVVERDLAAITARSPLELRFDPNNPEGRYITDKEDRHGGKFRRFYVSLENTSNKTIHHVRLRAQPGRLASMTVYVAHHDASRTYDDRLIICDLTALNPGDKRFVELFGIAHAAIGNEWHDGDEIVLEAIGEDVKLDRLVLAFTGGREPEFSALVPVGLSAPQSLPSASPRDTAV
jgi:hypothetical protein